MGRDYKNRVNQYKKKPPQTKITWWKWVSVFILISVFVVFLVNLGTSKTQIEQTQKNVQSLSIRPEKHIPKHQNKQTEEPRYDFYTILPETEIIIPDYEIDTRSREDMLGKGEKSKYVIQAGSFREFSEADKLRARLALMGIESRVEKATIGNVIWNRVKIGPYSHSSSVSVIKKRLKSSGIDAVVTELKG